MRLHHLSWGEGWGRGSGSLLRAVAASTTYGCCLRHVRLQPPPRTVAASAKYGCSLYCIRLQPLLHTVAASITYGCSPIAAFFVLNLLTSSVASLGATVGAPSRCGADAPRALRMPQMQMPQMPQMQVPARPPPPAAALR